MWIVKSVLNCCAAPLGGFSSGNSAGCDASSGIVVDVSSDVGVTASFDVATGVFSIMAVAWSASVPATTESLDLVVGDQEQQSDQQKSIFTQHLHVHRISPYHSSDIRQSNLPACIFE